MRYGTGPQVLGHRGRAISELLPFQPVAPAHVEAHGVPAGLQPHRAVPCGSHGLLGQGKELGTDPTAGASRHHVQGRDAVAGHLDPSDRLGVLGQPHVVLADRLGEPVRGHGRDPGVGLLHRHGHPDEAHDGLAPDPAQGAFVGGGGGADQHRHRLGPGRLIVWSIDARARTGGTHLAAPFEPSRVNANVGSDGGVYQSGESGRQTCSGASPSLAALTVPPNVPRAGDANGSTVSRR